MPTKEYRLIDITKIREFSIFGHNFALSELKDCYHIDGGLDFQITINKKSPTRIVLSFMATILARNRRFQ